MAAQKKRLSVKEAFQLAQQPHQNQAKLVVALSRTYGAVSGLASASGLRLLPLRAPRRRDGIRGSPEVSRPQPVSRTPGVGHTQSPVFSILIPPGDAGSYPLSSVPQ